MFAGGLNSFFILVWVTLSVVMVVMIVGFQREIVLLRVRVYRAHTAFVHLNVPKGYYYKYKCVIGLKENIIHPTQNFMAYSIAEM